MMNIPISLAYSSVKGGRSENQDFQLTTFTSLGVLSVVCDGVGGNTGGSIASRMAVNSIISYFYFQNSHSEPGLVLLNAVKTANKDILNRSEKEPNLKGMSTTVVAALITDKKVYVCHAGDSRFYQYRDGVQIFRTDDHSYVFELLKRNILKNEQQAKNHQRANEITSALGIKRDPLIECNTLEIEPGDFFLLCTDGVIEALEDWQILKNINQYQSTEESVKNLVAEAERIGVNKGGNHDNITVQLIKTQKITSSEPKEDSIALPPVFTEGNKKRLTKPNKTKNKKNTNIFYIILAQLFVIASFFFWLFFIYDKNNSDVLIIENDAQTETIYNKAEKNNNYGYDLTGKSLHKAMDDEEDKIFNERLLITRIRRGVFSLLPSFFKSFPRTEHDKDTIGGNSENGYEYLKPVTPTIN